MHLGVGLTRVCACFERASRPTARDEPLLVHRRKVREPKFVHSRHASGGPNPSTSGERHPLDAHRRKVLAGRDRPISRIGRAALALRHVNRSGLGTLRRSVTPFASAGDWRKRPRYMVQVTRHQRSAERVILPSRQSRASAAEGLRGARLYTAAERASAIGDARSPETAEGEGGRKNRIGPDRAIGAAWMKLLLPRTIGPNPGTG